MKFFSSVYYSLVVLPKTNYNVKAFFPEQIKVIRLKDERQDGQFFLPKKIPKYLLNSLSMNTDLGRHVFWV